MLCTLRSTIFPHVRMRISSFFSSSFIFFFYFDPISSNIFKDHEIIFNLIPFFTFSFDLKSKVWSTGHVEGDILDAKCIVGLKDELYFVGCGFNRTMVCSYHIEQKQWTARGNLKLEHKETCFKAVELNGAIFVVMCKLLNSFLFNHVFLISHSEYNNNHRYGNSLLLFIHIISYHSMF